MIPEKYVYQTIHNLLRIIRFLMNSPQILFIMNTRILISGGIKRRC